MKRKGRKDKDRKGWGKRNTEKGGENLLRIQVVYCLFRICIARSISYVSLSFFPSTFASSSFFLLDVSLTFFVSPSFSLLCRSPIRLPDSQVHHRGNILSLAPFRRRLQVRDTKDGGEGGWWGGGEAVVTRAVTTDGRFLVVSD